MNRMTGLFVSALLVLSAAKVRPAGVVAPLRIGHEKQLLFDDYVVGSLENVRRVLHHPERHRGNPILTGTEPWEKWVVEVYGRAVLYDEAAQEFKMWYGAHLSDPNYPTGIRYKICYAVSKDGIRWARPSLGQVEWEGSRQNNILKGGENWIRRPNIIEDLQERDPGRRFKMTYVDMIGGRTAIAKG